MRILVVNGPNLNLLGSREPAIYGTTTLAEIEQSLERLAGDLGVDVDFFQSNHEGALIDTIQGAVGRYQGVVLNPGAYTHSSLALADCLSALNLPCVEVHLSNLHRREPIRRRSLTARAALGIIQGFGPQSYELGLTALVRHLQGVGLLQAEARARA